MCSEWDNTTLLVLSSLIRRSADWKMFAPPRSFSQLTTSFFGAICQGILREPFVAWSFSTRLSLQILWLLRLQNVSTKFPKSPNKIILSRFLVLTFRPYILLTVYMWIFLPYNFLFLLCSCQSSVTKQQFRCAGFCSLGGIKWTRTTDLTLIRRVL